MNALKFLTLTIIFHYSFISSQNSIESNRYLFPRNTLINQLTNHHYKNNLNNNDFELSLTTNYLFSSAHPNLDNYGELYSAGKSTFLNSVRFKYKNQWMFFEIEPYTLTSTNKHSETKVIKSYKFLNNQSNQIIFNKRINGFKQSQLILHYKGVGIGYGFVNHWWGPSFHTSITLTTNSPSQETFSFGTFKDIKIGKFSFNSKIISIPYQSINNKQLYLTGLRSHLKLNSNPQIELGLHRLFYSGQVSSDNTLNWSIKDATNLVLEPLFGRDKTDLLYTKPGTPGFDDWDQILDGYFKLNFPDDNLEIYLSLSSDDSRGNSSDLLAHWDHTLAYQIGLKKLSSSNWGSSFFGLEYFTNRVSNTFNPLFYRGKANITNYYFYERFDFSTYRGRRFGAHSGSSSSDLIFTLGIIFNQNVILLSINHEKHGIKYSNNPELKNEVNLTYNRKISNNINLSITFEHELIKNYGFANGKLSTDNMFLFSTEYHLNNIF